MSRFTGRIWRYPMTWTLVSLSLAVGLHARRLPAWVIGAFVLLCMWRSRLAARGASLPSRPLRWLAIFLTVLAVLGAYRTLNGVDAGTALLVLMAGLKLLETKERRDHLVMLLIAYFLVMAAFLRDQNFWMLPLYGLSVWATTAALLRVTQSREGLPAGECVRLSGRMLVQAAPFMVILFILFPRMPGPFWGLPANERTISGLGEEMNPGEISELTLSSEPVFRVRFHGAVPPPSQRYWRGPVLHEFDGRSWRMPRYAAVGGEVRFSGPVYEYSLMMEPSSRPWVFALDLPEDWPRGYRGYLGHFDYQLTSRRPLDRAVTIQLRSRTSYVAGPELSHTLRAMDTRIPERSNLRARELAMRMREQAGSEEAYVGAVLQMFREEAFVYTLTPPLLEHNAVDHFLFVTRQGFCEHFASAFAFLMRAAGIPARVVTGYQGGEYNRIGEYWIVRQSDAHAWTEIWLAGRGWVRVDPTAAVAPERIERGSSEMSGAAAAATQRLLREYSWLARVRDTWDAANTWWRERILNFNLRSQLSLLERLGIPDPDWRILAWGLGASLVLGLIVLGVVMGREMRFRQADPVVQAYRRFCRRLARIGLERLPHEGPMAFAERIRRLRPDLAQQTDVITGQYLDLRYGPAGTTAQAIGEFCKRVSRFRPAPGLTGRAAGTGSPG